MSATLVADIYGRADRTQLAVRLAALDQVTQIGAARTGPDGFREELIAEAADVLSRAGQRLRLSSRHTVVALAGGTGSGKSSLFNRLSGADFSTVGVTRPVTRDAHACVWGMAGAGPLLEWLGVPRRHRYARSSALATGEQSMSGLVLLDLPDHDSVLSHATDVVDKLVGLSDVMIWVLDPQKYADFAVHRRFLVPLAGHAEVVAVVLNQCDVLTPGQIEDCVQDLRRLLDSESLHDAQILVTSAKTGEGIEELRKLLSEAVTARRAATARIVADVDKVVTGFEPYAERVPGGGSGVPKAVGQDAGEELPEGTDSELGAALAEAAGVRAIGDSLRSARELRAADYVGWPVSWLIERFTSPSPARKVQLGRLWEQLRDVTAGPSGAQQAEIDNAVTWVADSQVPDLPKPWSRTVRAALRSRAEEIPGAIGAEVAGALPASPVVDRWWRLIGILQGLLLGCVLVGFAWLVALLVLGVGKVDSGVPKLFGDPWLLPWPAVLIVAGLAGGWLADRLGTQAVSEAAVRETDELVDDIYRRLTLVAQDLVVGPAEHELGQLRLFRRELRVAAGG
jgi:GTP-binding protein EngB required for normal cell division